MRNLFLFVWKYNFFFLFIILEVVCFLLMAQSRSYRGTSLLNSTNQVSATLYSTLANAKDYLALKEENDKLAAENAFLKNKLRDAFEGVPIKAGEVNDTLFRQKYKFLSAKVINNSINRRDNYITLNIGANQGVVADMGVFNSEGIVGITKDVSSNYTSCLSFLNKGAVVATKLKDGTIGQLKWDGRNPGYALMTDVPTQARILKGDTVVTSGLSKFFPAGIKVGTIEHYERRASEPYYTIKLKLLTNFSKINHVYVVINMFKAEQDSLEIISQKPDDKK